MLKAKIIVPHRSDCMAVKETKRGFWSTPWTGIVEERFWGDAIGRKSRKGHLGHIWYVMVCNSTDCNAKKIVNSTAIAEIGGI